MTEQGGERLLLRVEEAAELLSLGRSVTWELVASGRLRSVKIGAARRVPREALGEFIAGLSEAPR